MKKEFFHGTTRGLRISFVGFSVAVVGIVLGFFGFYLEERSLSILGFLIVVTGVAVGFVGIVYGWVYQGRNAIKGSVKAAKELRSKLR